MSLICAAHPPSLAANAFGAPLDRNLVEPRLSYGQLGAALNLFQHELDQRGRLFRVVNARIHGVRMPSKGEQPHRLDPLDLKLETISSVRFLPIRDLSVDARRHHLADNALARDDGSSNSTPNQLPNCVESLIARQTRSRGARSNTLFSIRSVLAVIRNLQVACNITTP